MRHVFLTAALFLTATLPAQAHRLVVYATVDADAAQIVVETKFSNGNPAQLGDIRLLDADAQPLGTFPLERGGLTRIDIPEIGAEGGITVEVETDEGHDDYWVLTPADLGMEP
ncbi:hypothetical protein [Oceanibium sediminis]|uniref:hypothetical protein n=1 Tax=Oceanibium sediminis TaxID=2026339 RepID=UPI000DD39C07|nr:hypothetical protein [Oceanibium sediminis]